MYNHVRYNDILQFLEQHQQGVLGSRLSCGTLTTSYIPYAVNEHLQMHFGSCRGYATCAAFAHHPDVSITVLHDSTHPRFAAEIRGTVEYIPSEHTDATRSWLLRRNRATLFDHDHDDFVICKVQPRVIRFMDLTTSRPRIDHINI